MGIKEYIYEKNKYNDEKNKMKKIKKRNKNKGSFELEAETATGLLVPDHELNILKREIMVLSGVVHPDTERQMQLLLHSAHSKEYRQNQLG